ncbi:MAG: ATP-binding cassette domain-containing protein [Verrucomicrobiae bacterium]|nr:ATP-binding cassette domain-containing protein [Verrucomicrobiae bacterium]
MNPTPTISTGALPSAANHLNPPSPPVVLEVDHLHVERGGYRALQDVSFVVRAGEFVAVMGRSGAGKTTLMHVLAGLLAPSAGRVHWEGACGQPCCRRPAPTNGQPDVRVAVMFQHYRLVPQLSALANVICGRLGAYPWWRTAVGWPRAEKQLALRWLNRVGLGERAALKARQLSGGEQQRVGFARALIQEPTVLLADEPVASLDAETANEMMGLLAELNRQSGLTIICVLHDLEMAERYTQRVLLLDRGLLLHDGPAENLAGLVREKLQWQTL